MNKKTQSKIECGKSIYEDDVYERKWKQVAWFALNMSFSRKDQKGINSGKNK